MQSTYAGNCATQIISNALHGLRQTVGLDSNRVGSTHKEHTTAEAVAYIELFCPFYLGALKRSQFSGVVAEIGPGDSLGVALMMLANGAREVHSIDRFYSERDEAAETMIYRDLADRYDLGRFFSGPPSQHTLKGVRYFHGAAAEDFFAKSVVKYDAIVSVAVLEHLKYPILGLDRMFDALAGGGGMVHRVDLNDHGMFVGHHPLTFLTVPGPIYRLMVSNSGRPNRVMFHKYREWAAKHGGVMLEVTRLVGEDNLMNQPANEARIHKAAGRVAQIRKKLAAEFQNISDEDLAVNGFTIIVRKD